MALLWKSLGRFPLQKRLSNPLREHLIMAENGLRINLNLWVSSFLFNVSNLDEILPTFAPLLLVRRQHFHLELLLGNPSPVVRLIDFAVAPLDVHLWKEYLKFYFYKFLPKLPEHGRRLCRSRLQTTCTHNCGCRRRTHHQRSSLENLKYLK